MRKAGILFFIMIIILTGVLRVDYYLKPVDNTDTSPVGVEVNRGASAGRIASKLYHRGLIHSPWFLNLVLNIKGLDNQLQAGYYQFSPSQGLMEIIDHLTQGRVAVFKLTIPEGFTVEEIADRLAENTDYSREDFLEAARSAVYEREFLPDSEGDHKYILEGFLFPSTYRIPLGYNPEETYRLILDHFQREWWPRLQEEAREREYSPMAIMTIASLIEEEARLDDEKPIIAGVIFNRLENGMLLQIDAGIQYSLHSRKQRILYRDLEIDSPYNTYKYGGLPPGPICSPGDKAIEAALNPEDVDYFFYFALDDGQHVFTETYSEHIRMQEKMKRKGLIDEQSDNGE